MDASRPANESDVAVMELAGILGLRWAAYDADGEFTGGTPPWEGDLCAHFPACPIRNCHGVCPGAASAPLGGGGELTGKVSVCRGTPDQPVGVEVATALASAIEARRRAELEMEGTVRELAATYQELGIAYGVLEAISLPTSRELIAQSLLAHLAVALDASSGACFLCVDPGGESWLLAAVGLSELDAAALRGALPTELERRPGCDNPFVFDLGTRQVLASAIADENGGRGAIAVCRETDTPFTSREAKLLRASGRQAALAIRNRTLVDELRSLFVSTVQALVAAIEAKDPYTCGHSRRVAEQSLATATRLGLSEAEMDDIHTAAMVHDVGKIGVDTAILRKEGRLEDCEWMVVRGHPERGAGIIGCVPQLQHIAPVVRHHHERLDGQGYPFGLHGRQIPQSSGIIAVCDSYDAMTSERPYRSALSHSAARRELILCSGTQFEPRVVAAFLEVCAA